MAPSLPQPEIFHAALGGTIDADHTLTKRVFDSTIGHHVSQIFVPQTGKLRSELYLAEEYPGLVVSEVIARKDSKDVLHPEVCLTNDRLAHYQINGVKGAIVTEGTDAATDLAKYLKKHPHDVWTIPIVLVVAKTPLSVEDPNIVLPRDFEPEWSYDPVSDGYENLRVAVEKIMGSKLKPGVYISAHKYWARADRAKKDYTTGEFSNKAATPRHPASPAAPRPAP